VDGIPATLPDGQSSLDHLDLGSLGGVEALRGPSSALYGNASGGVLAFRTARPAPVPVRQEVGLIRGSDGYQRLQATTSGVAGQTGYLLNLASLRYDGFRTNPVAGSSGSYGAAERLNVNGRVERPLLGGQLGLVLNAVDLDSENPGSLTLAPALEDPTRPAFTGNVTARTGKTVRQAQAGATWTGPLGRPGGVQGELAVFGVRREIGNPIPGTIVDLDRWAWGGRGIVRWDQPRPGATGGARLWVAGGEVEVQLDDRLNYRNVLGERGSTTLDQGEQVVAAGAFVQTLSPLSATLLAMGGIRLDRIAFQADDRFPRPGGRSQSGDRSLGAISPSAGLRWAPREGTGIHANVTTSFESPTTTELANRPDGAGGFNPDLAPQRGVGGEVGVRTTFAGAIEVEGTAFLTGVTNELIPFEDAASPGRVFYRNAGSSRYQGAELRVATPSARLLAGEVTWSWTDARFRDYTVGTNDWSGNQVPGQAPRRGEAIVTARHLGVTAELRGVWSDEIPVNDANTASAPSHSLVDFRLGTDPVRLGVWRITPTFGVTNLLDERYISSVAVNAFGGRFFEPGPGRSLHLGGSVSVERRQGRSQ
jgi:iron complex outermembrane recepter protein